MTAIKGKRKRGMGIVAAEWLSLDPPIAIVGYENAYNAASYRVVMEEADLVAMSPEELGKWAERIGMYVLGFRPVE